MLGALDPPQVQGTPLRIGRRVFNRAVVIQYGLSLLTVVLVLGPILPILYQSLIDRPLYDAAPTYTLRNYVDLVVEPSFGRIILNTAMFAGAATILGTAIGLVMAILLGRTDIPGRQALGGLILWPIFVSQLVLAFGWFIVYGPAGYATLWLQTILGEKPWNLYSVGGMSLVAGISLAPLTYLYCIASTALSEASLEDAARSCGAGPFRTLRSITLPLLRPAILYSIVLNFTGALEMLAIPLVFGEPTGFQVFSTFLYHESLISPRPNYGMAATAAVLLLVVIVLLLMLQRRLLHNSGRFVTVGGKASRTRPLTLGPYRWPVFAVVLACIILFVLLPLVALVLRASVSVLSPLVPFWEHLTLRHMTNLVTSDAAIRAIVNTLVIAVVGAAIGTVFVALLTVIVHRSTFRFRGLLEFVALFPRAVPGVVAGVGFFYAMVLIPPMGWLRNTIWILVLAYIMRFIPMAFGAMAPALMQFSRDLDSSARVMGADWWTTTRAITLRLMKPAMFSSYALLFVYSLKEYTTAVFLFTPGNEVIGSVLLMSWSNGDMGLVAALSTVQILLTVLFIYGVRKLFAVKIHG